ncbi:MAG: SUMF1/EgtB/PvdO family nonheme iron enzyme [Candidatus Omnitrophica bacterium]|nr:SUMF1/EgtB/PvdO family nonheme iron enzyme [Candidatus Omnitrophota bacterium]MCB9720887.1 SUMF1/EgtB/PvdO family nonheme iron enzyme [Candidatus Omnitrophota bacterium]
MMRIDMRPALRFVLGTVTSLALIFPGTALANHLQIDNYEVTAIDEASNMMTFTGDFMWENSWRNVNSNDAVWVFVKYSLDGGATWNHASMTSSGLNPIGFAAPAGFQIVVPNDERGFFLEPTSFSSGDVNVQGVRFSWDYAQDGLSDEQAMAANTITKVFGIEMVKIPEGAFYAGDGNSSSAHHFKQGLGDNDPWYIESSGAINVANAGSDGYYYQSAGASGESATGSSFLIPTSFPKGYSAFYVMKYELTEGQWVSFFNTLSYAQKMNRDITAASRGGKNTDTIVNRNTVSWDAGNPRSQAGTSRPDRPVTYISWPDLLAYADWAGLRPVTELEYEKAARGVDVLPVADEYAWGKTTYNDAQAGEIYPNADETGQEQIFDGAANLNRNALSWSSGDGRPGGPADGQKGPLRVGIFAEDSTNRVTSGSGFYGTMELSGNLAEMVVSVGRTEGRNFLGSHGDGILSSATGYAGNATNIDWPGIDPVDPNRGVTSTVGSGTRGGDFQSADVRLFQISTRTNATRDPDSQGYYQRFDPAFGVFQGGRLARTAP